jgi:hypothetical protein
MLSTWKGIKNVWPHQLMIGGTIFYQIIWPLCPHYIKQRQHRGQGGHSQTFLNRVLTKVLIIVGYKFCKNDFFVRFLGNAQHNST